ncbi:hypothetical protein AB0F93_00080 [Micromonospora tulbaghiae]|uniref:hypothetical protein n=1 Tax=Micromonospora tulbaghiae TaxID=479978 RepID=UPI003328BC3F
MANNSDPTPRTFVKQVRGEKKTRTVLTEADAVNARFEGFTEEKSSKSGGSKPSGSSSSS